MKQLFFIIMENKQTNDSKDLNFTRDFIGKTITSVRQEKGLSQIRLAELSGLKQSQISDIERGKFSPSFTTVFVICKAMKVSFSDFLYKSASEIEIDISETYPISFYEEKLENIQHELMEEEYERKKKRYIRDSDTKQKRTFSGVTI